MRVHFALLSGARVAARDAPRVAPRPAPQPAPVPPTNWADPLYAHGARTPPQTLALNMTPQKLLSRRQIMRRMTLHFHRGHALYGPLHEPLVHIAPPVALPSAKPLRTDSTEALRESKALVEGLYAQQVVGGDYSPYSAEAALKHTPPTDAAGNAVAGAAQALRHNVSAHPEARRTLVGIVAQRVGVSS